MLKIATSLTFEMRMYLVSHINGMKVENFYQFEKCPQEFA